MPWASRLPILVRYDIIAPPQYTMELASSTQLKRGRIKLDTEKKVIRLLGNRALDSSANKESTLRDRNVREHDTANITTVKIRPN